MVRDSDLKALIERHCTTTETFQQVLSMLLVTAHTNGVNVSGAWEAHENGGAPEWDVVVTELARDHSKNPSKSNQTDEDSE
jgi:hypothetical protein